MGFPLIGTAARGDVWLLLEYSERWGAKAFDESGGDQWQITVSSTHSGASEQIHIQRRVSDYDIPITCSKKISTGEFVSPS